MRKLKLNVLLFFNLLSLINTSVLPQPPLFVKVPAFEKLFVAEDGDSVTPFAIECETISQPKTVYRWLKNGSPFDIHSLNHVTMQPGRGSLVFTHPKKEDEGIYQCIAQNEFGTATSNVVHVRRTFMNNFTDETVQLIDAVEYKSLSIPCDRPEGYPRPKLHWFILSKEGSIKTINNERFSVDSDGTLHFTSVKIEDKLDDKYYACAASLLTTAKYSIGKRITLNVTSATEQKHKMKALYVSPGNVNVVKGERLDLTCIYGGTFTPEISWRKNGNKIPSDVRINYLNFGRTIRIENTTLADNGTYECFAADSNVGRLEKHSIRVTVQSAPTVSTNSNIVYKEPGESVTFSCKADGVPKPFVKWMKNGEPIDTHTNQRIKVHETSLTIAKLTKQDTAVYQCNASNIHGYEHRNFGLMVVNLPPHISTKGQEIKTRKNSTISLECKVIATPKAEVKWIKGIRLLNVSFDSKNIENGNYSLVLTNVRKQDEGEYTCRAMNKFGSYEYRMNLIIEEETKIIKKPAFVRVLNIVSERSALIEWAAVNASTAKIDGYKIQSWTEDECFNKRREIIVPANVTKSLVHILKPNKVNIIQVLAFSGDSDGFASKALRVLTPKGTPEKVSFFTVVGIAADEVLLIWQPPTNQAADVNGYKIHIKEFDSEGELIDISKFSKTSNLLTEKIKGLNEEKTYRVSINAINEQGNGEPSSVDFSLKTYNRTISKISVNYLE